MNRGSLLDRLGYIRLLFRGSTWAWLIRAIDYTVEDHLHGWARLRRGAHCEIHPSVGFRCGENIELGNHTRIQPNCLLWASPHARITVGDYSGIGPGSMLFTSNHRFAPGVPYHQQEWNEADIHVGRDVWIGAGSIILSGVTIGDGCVVAAGSVVTKDLAPNSIAVGAPARVIRSRVAETPIEQEI